MGDSLKVAGLFLAIILVAVLLGVAFKSILTTSTVPDKCISRLPCGPEMSVYTPTFSILPTFSTVSIDSYNIGDTVTKTLTVSNSSVVVDKNYADGDVNYVYAEWIIIKDGSEYQSGDWVELSSPSYSKHFSQSFSQPGRYAFVVVMVSANSTYDSSTGKWLHYTVSKVGEAEYLFTVNAPEPSDPLSALMEFFNNLLSSLVGLIKNIFNLT